MPASDVVVLAWNKDGYSRVILTGDEVQFPRMHDDRIKSTIDGMEINPKDFPEAVRFTIKVSEWRRPT